MLGIPSGCLSHPAQRARRAFRTLCSARGRLFRVPLGHGPSLNGLRQWLAVTMWLNTFVRPLHRYYSRVRLPGRVHVESAASGLLRPDRPRDTRSSASGISRFPCKKFVYMPWFSDSAGPMHHLRLRGAPCGLPAFVTGSATRGRLISELYSLACTPPVNASPPPLRRADA